MKRTIFSILSIFLLSAISILSTAQEHFDLSGKVHYNHFSYFNTQQNKINSRNEGLMQVQLASKRESSLQWKAVSELREDLSDATRNRFWLDELWAKQQFGSFDVTLGKQLISWGTADGINPINNINPTDYTDLLDTEDERIGVYALRLQWFLDMADIDLLYVPLASFGVLPAPNSRWFPSPEMMGLLTTLGSGIPISLQSNAPESTLKTGEFGIRYRKRFSGADIGLSYYNGYDHLPEFTPDMSQFDPNAPQLVLLENYNRQQVFGAEWVVLLPWGMAFRGESGLFVPEENNSTNDRYIQTVAGIDKNLALNNSSLTIIAQYIYDHNLEDNTYEKFDLRHLFINSPMANIDWAFNNGLSINLLSIYNIDSKDYYLSPEIGYNTIAGLNFTLQTDILGGESGTFFGDYSYNNRVRAKMSYQF
ncbi:MAG: hypothetical protein PF436_01030 [Prolixibacteraceae bacterium]|jgi:hypothetical protein|nr:hypothetical protein [Prolixibacteraceae bacterium]